MFSFPSQYESAATNDYEAIKNVAHNFDPFDDNLNLACVFCDKLSSIVVQKNGA